jgi:hypothetical protein
VSFAAITLCVASQRVFFVVVVDFVIDSVRKLWIHPRTSLIGFTSCHSKCNIHERWKSLGIVVYRWCDQAPEEICSVISIFLLSNFMQVMGILVELKTVL